MRVCEIRIHRFPNAVVCHSPQIQSRLEDLESKNEKLDMILCELDSNAIKICEYVRERSISEDSHWKPLIPVLMFLPGDNAHGMEDTLQKCLDLGSPGFLFDPPSMGQLILTSGLILKQYEMIHEAYRSTIVKEEGKAYPKFELAAVSSTSIPGLHNNLNMMAGLEEGDDEDADEKHEVELTHVSEDQRFERRGPISDEGKRPVLHRKKSYGNDEANIFSPG